MRPLFCTPHYQAVRLDDDDVPLIAGIYNSDSAFLKKHAGVASVDEAWALREYRNMLENGFLCCKIIDKSNPIGFMEFKMSEEVYLSLLMINATNRKRGVGKEVFRCFEEYVKSQNCKRIRIDVAADEPVLKFWLKNGFITEKEITMSWNGKEFTAEKMIKHL